MIIGFRTLFITLTLLAAVNAFKMLPARIRREQQRQRSKARKLSPVNIRGFSDTKLCRSLLVHRPNAAKFICKRKSQ